MILQVDDSAQQLQSVLKHNWGWMFAFGVLSTILGILAVVYAGLTTLFSINFLGWLLLFSGVIEIFTAFKKVNHGRYFWHIVNALLSLTLGGLFLVYPLEGVFSLTLLIAVYFIVTGGFNIINAISMKFLHWGWALANGLISLVLGISILRQLPESSLWLIGLFVGFNLIVNGWSEMMLGLAARKFTMTIQ